MTNLTTKQTDKSVKAKKVKRVVYKVAGHWHEMEVEELFVLGGTLSYQHPRAMHPYQEAVLKASKEHDFKGLTLRDIAVLSGMPPMPQLVKHHLEQLKKKGLLK